MTKIRQIWCFIKRRNLLLPSNKNLIKKTSEVTILKSSPYKMKPIPTSTNKIDLAIPRIGQSSCLQLEASSSGSQTGRTIFLFGCSKTQRWPVGILSVQPAASPKSE